MIEQMISVIENVARTAEKSHADIRQVTAMTRMLSVNALIEAAHAGEKGRGFAVVAQEVERVSETITTIAKSLEKDLSHQLLDADRLGKQFATTMRGLRLAELSLNMIEIIDRNLYERSCDVRWWATDSAVVACARERNAENAAFASKRLGIILDSYTVYLDIWILDACGNVLANGRPQKYPRVVGSNHATASWFRDAIATRDGTQFAVSDVAIEPAFGRSVATYSAAIHDDEQNASSKLGVMAIWFDWQAQSQAIVDGVHMPDEEKGRTRCLLLDSACRVIAASDGKGLLAETFPLRISEGDLGSYTQPDGALVGYALTPGYETYEGLGWYGVVVQGVATFEPVNRSQG